MIRRSNLLSNLRAADDGLSDDDEEMEQFARDSPLRFDPRKTARKEDAAKELEEQWDEMNEMATEHGARELRDDGWIVSDEGGASVADAAVEEAAQARGYDPLLDEDEEEEVEVDEDAPLFDESESYLESDDVVDKLEPEDKARLRSDERAHAEELMDAAVRTEESYVSLMMDKEKRGWRPSDIPVDPKAPLRDYMIDTVFSMNQVPELQRTAAQHDRKTRRRRSRRAKRVSGRAEYKEPKPSRRPKRDPLIKSDFKGPRVLELPAFLEPRDLARQLKVSLGELSKICGKVFPSWWPKGLSAKKLTKRQTEDHSSIVLSYSEASLVATYMGYTALPSDLEGDLKREPDGHVPNFEPKLPVVTILGHVDHGKTTLLDRLRGGRGESLAPRESGGITQDVYTFQVPLPPDDHVVTFLDTPGHREFMAMRRTGAMFADLAVLVVAADEGLQSQTRESLERLIEFGVPIIVALNKIDSRSAKVDRVMAQLEEAGLNLVQGSLPDNLMNRLFVDEEGSGDDEAVDVQEATESITQTPVVPISALRGDGVAELAQLVSLYAEALDPQADSAGRPEGAVLDAYPRSGRGTIVKAIFFKGQAQVGQRYVCGSLAGKIRSMSVLEPDGVSKFNASTVYAGVPVELSGLVSGIPEPGEEIVVMPDDKVQDLTRLRKLEELFQSQPRFHEAVDEVGQGRGVGEVVEEEEEEESLPSYWDMMHGNVAKEEVEDNPFTPASEPVVEDREALRHVPLMIKAGNAAALQTLAATLEHPVRLPSGEMVQIAVVDASVGPVGMKDLAVAKTAPCPVLCFRTPPTPDHLVHRAQHEMGVPIQHFDVMYVLGHYVEELAQATLGTGRSKGEKKRMQRARRKQRMKG